MLFTLSALTVLLSAPSFELTVQPRTQELLSAEPTDRVRKCGLGKAFHAGRRAALREELEEGIVVIRGMPDTREYREFRQDKSFWYLTGVESRDAALVMDLESGREVLFLPAGGGEIARTEVWDGEIWDDADDWVPSLTGFSEVRAAEEMQLVIEEMLSSGEGPIWTSSYPNIRLAESSDRALKFNGKRKADPFDARPSRERALRNALEIMFPDAKQRNFSNVLENLRVHKTPEEMVAMRHAADASVLAMNEAIRSTRAGIGEWDLDAVMGFVHQRNGAEGPAYEAIAGAGPNALVLHYLASDRVLRAQEMLLIDYACEASHYTCDLTRSWPTSGGFTGRMAELYDAVLAAQEAGIAAAKPGMTLMEISAVCQNKIVELGYGQLTLHGACHFIGMEVHDPGPFREKLGVGACFTIEPGLYDPEENIGIRIEDVVVLTEGGCEVITKGSPKTREALLNLREEEGLLDRLDRPKRGDR